MKFNSFKRRATEQEKKEYNLSEIEYIPLFHCNLLNEKDLNDFFIFQKDVKDNFSTISIERINANKHNLLYYFAEFYLTDSHWIIKLELLKKKYKKWLIKK